MVSSRLDVTSGGMERPCSSLMVTLFETFGCWETSMVLSSDYMVIAKMPPNPSLVAILEQFGVAKTSEIDADSLPQRMYEQVTKLRSYRRACRDWGMVAQIMSGGPDLSLNPDAPQGPTAASTEASL